MGVALNKEGMDNEDAVYDCIKTFRLGGNHKTQASVPIFIRTFQKCQRDKLSRVARRTPDLQYLSGTRLTVKRS